MGHISEKEQLSTNAADLLLIETPGCPSSLWAAPVCLPGIEENSFKVYG